MMQDPSLQDPASLANLRDLVAPEAVPFWPPAHGWFGLAIAALVVVVWWLRCRARRSRAEAYRVSALNEIDALDRDGGLAGLPSVLRRAALAAFPRTEIAPPVGDDWVSWIDAHGGRFGPDLGARLIALGYDPAAAPPSEAERAALLDAARSWVCAHPRTERDRC